MSGFTELSEPVRVFAALATSFAVTFALMPFVRRLAVRTRFYDEPVGYKKHSAHTPYLGGLAVIAGALVAAAAFGSALDAYFPLFVCALALCALGTLDDRVGLPVLPRLATQIVIGYVIWDSGLGWQFLSDGGDLALTILWVVGLINAFNLMDNLDGAAGTVGAVSSAGAGLLALIQDQPALACFAFSITGACVAFLRFNLAKPSRIFLGDGGSMPLGLMIAVIVATLPNRSIGLENLLAVVPIVGLVILDTMLVVASRTRRGAPVFSGGRDHLTHRFLLLVGSPQRVALCLAGAQVALCVVAIGLYGASENVIAWSAAAYVPLGLAAIAALEVPWFVRRTAPAEQSA